MITRLHIKGFKRLLDVDLEMRPLMVMIGANGSGKSSLLEAVSMISMSMSGGLSTFMEDSNGMSSVATSSPEIKSLSCTVDFQVIKNHVSHDSGDSAAVRYSFTLAKVGYGFRVTDEWFGEIGLQSWLTKSDNTGSSPFHETAFAGLYDAESNAVRHAFTISRYASSNFDSHGKVLDAQQLIPAKNPGSRGQHLLSFLYSLRERSPERFEELLFVLESVFPSFKKFSLPLVANGTVCLQWWEKNLDTPLSAFQLSEGTLRFLWLAAALLSEEMPAITIIDEPETSMHPELLRYLADLMRGASARTQLLVATQSESLVRFLEPSEVAVVDRDEKGFASIRWADSMNNIEEWLKDYSLEELWGKGILGGRSR